MANVLYNVLECFNITKRLLYITTDNAGNNGTMRKVHWPQSGPVWTMAFFGDC